MFTRASTSSTSATDSLNLLVFQIVFLLASAAAVPVQVAPDGYGPSAVPYGPSPPSYADRAEPPRSYKVKSAYQEEEEEEKFEPQPYKYEYGVQDDYSKAAFAKSETQNEVGAVTGSYKVSGVRVSAGHTLCLL